MRLMDFHVDVYLIDDVQMLMMIFEVDYVAAIGTHFSGKMKIKFIKYANLDIKRAVFSQ